MKINQILRINIFIILSCALINVQAKIVLFAPNDLISKTKFELLKRDFSNILNHLSNPKHVQAAQAIINVIAKDQTKFHFASMMQHQLTKAVKNRLSLFDTERGRAVLSQTPQLPDKALVLSQKNVQLINNDINDKKQPKGLEAILSFVKASAQTINANFAQYAAEHVRDLKNKISEKDMVIMAQDDLLSEKEQMIDHMANQLKKLNAKNDMIRAQFGHPMQDQLIAQTEMMVKHNNVTK